MLLRRLLPLRLSLRRLFAYVSVFAVACGSIVQFPDTVAVATAAVTITTLLFGPSLLVCTWFARHSSKPWLTCFLAASGIGIGVFLSPGLMANLKPLVLWVAGFPWRWYRFVDIGFLDFSLPPLFALLVGSIAWYVSQNANLVDDSLNDERARRREA